MRLMRNVSFVTPSSIAVCVQKGRRHVKRICVHLGTCAHGLPTCRLIVCIYAKLLRAVRAGENRVGGTEDIVPFQTWGLSNGVRLCK